MNNGLSIFFLAFAILSIFGIRGLIIAAIGYAIYKAVEASKKSEVKEKKKATDALEDFLTNVLSEVFDDKVQDAKVVKKKKNQKTSYNPPSFNFNFMSTKGYISLAGIVIAALIILDGLVMVPAGHVAVILDRGRGVLEESLPTGLHLKIPFWQKATVMSTRLQTYTMSGSTSEGELYGNDAIEALTKDGQKVNIDVTVQFFLPAENASQIYNTVGLDYVDKIVRPAARSVIRNVITGSNSKELFQIETREAAQAQMVEGMTTNLEAKKLVLDDVLLRNIQFSEIYLQAIEDKQIAEQKIQKAEFEKQEAEIQKEKKIIEAEAEAESIKLKGESLRQNPEVIQLEMVNKLAPSISWGILPDGVLPLLDLKGQ